MNNENMGLFMHQINIQCKNSANEPVSKVITISDEYSYSNIRIKLPSTMIHIRIHAISRVQIYSDMRSVNMWHPNICEYLSGKLCGIQIYSDICSGPF